MADLYDLIWLKPIDEGLLLDIFSKYDAIVTVEDGVLAGGFGSAVAELMIENNVRLPLKRLGVEDKWIHHATVAQQKQESGIDAEAIKKVVRDLYKKYSAK